MENSFIFWFYCGWVMEDLEFGFELCDWLWFSFRSYQNHSSPNIFPDKFFVSLWRSNIETSKITSNSNFTCIPRNMYGSNLNLLKLFSFIRSKKAIIIYLRHSTSNNSGKYNTNTFHNKAFINFKLKWLLFKLLDRWGINIKPRDEIDQNTKALLGYTGDRENRTYCCCGHLVSTRL